MRNTTLLRTTLTLSLGMLFHAHAQTPFGNGLVAYYPFNGNFDDASGRTNHGTAFNAILIPDRAGNASRACYFNGTNAHIHALAGGLPTTDRTVALWINATSIAPGPGAVGNGTGVIGYGGGNCGNSFLMLINNGDGGGDQFETQGHCRANRLFAPLPGNLLGHWHHWAVTVSGTVIRMFLDGQQIAQESSFFTPTAVLGKDLIIGMDVAPSGMGTYSDNNTGPYYGALDEVRIYSRALTPDEVAALHAYESQPQISLLKAVRPSFDNLALGTNYQLQISGDMNTWTNYATPFAATNTSMRYPQYFDVDNWSALFFRLQRAAP